MVGKKQRKFNKRKKQWQENNLVRKFENAGEKNKIKKSKRMKKILKEKGILKENQRRKEEKKNKENDS